MMRDRASLLGVLEELDRLPRTAERRLALAEAEFRLAVDPAAAPAEAIVRLRRAVAHDPFAAKLHLHLGRALHRDGRHRAAAVAYRQAGRRAPGSRRVRLLLALALLELDKQERDVGQRLLDALAADDPEAGKVALADLDLLLAGRPATIGRQQASPVNLGRAAAPDTWRPALVACLSQATVIRKRMLAQLEMGRSRLAADGLVAYATACVLMLVCGEAAGTVRQLMTEVGLDRQPDHPAVAVLVAALELAELDDPLRLVEEISRQVERGLLPPELACWLHYARHVDAPPPTLTAMRLLDAYPRAIATLDCFVELRIAILDDYARRAWAERRYDAARLLWQEAGGLDPHRVAIVANLALLAARTRATDEYGPAWERLAEVLYLHSAAVGDVQLYLEDRLTLHLALARQSADRPRAAGGGRTLPTERELAAWIAEPDAVEVWLREWDLYYLNARLRFRSGRHLLGVPADAGSEALTEAHEAHVRHLDRALAGPRWRGLAEFRHLARARADEALRTALRDTGPGTDPNHEPERARAEALTEELVERVRLLQHLMKFLAHQRSSVAVSLSSSVAMRQFALPSGPLQRLCVERGLVERGESLVDAFATELIKILAGWDRPEGEKQCTERLAALDRCLVAAPHLIAVHFHRCRLLHQMGRDDDAYAGAVEAVALRRGGPSTEEAEHHRAELVALIDGIGRAARRRSPSSSGAGSSAGWRR